MGLSATRSSMVAGSTGPPDVGAWAATERWPTSTANARVTVTIAIRQAVRIMLILLVSQRAVSECLPRRALHRAPGRRLSRRRGRAGDRVFYTDRVERRPPALLLLPPELHMLALTVH